MATASSSRIAFCGDVYIGERCVRVGPALARRMHDVHECCVNLESPIIDGKGRCLTEKNCPLYSHSQILTLLHDLNCSVASICNNHICDWGESGVRGTIEFLNENNIAALGAGLALQEASRPITVSLAGGSVGLLSYGEPTIGCKPAEPSAHGCNPAIAERMLDEISDLRREVDVVIPQVHIGLTNYHIPLPSTRRLFRSLVDAGASAVVGHHPHVIQGREVYRGSPIYYSLGNLVFAPILRDHGWMYLSGENRHSMIIVFCVRDGKLATEDEVHTSYDVHNDILEQIGVAAKRRKRARRFERWSRRVTGNLDAYEPIYRRYVLRRMIQRATWRLHPLRWNEISGSHLRALLHGIRRR